MRAGWDGGGDRDGLRERQRRRKHGRVQASAWSAEEAEASGWAAAAWAVEEEQRGGEHRMDKVELGLGRVEIRVGLV